MQAGGRALSVRERGWDYFDLVRGKDGSQLVDAKLICAVALAYQQRAGVQPDDVAGLGGGGAGDLACCRDALGRKEFGLVLGFGDAVGFAGSHQDEALIRRKRRVVGVEGVEGKVGAGGERQDVGSGLSHEFA